MVDILGKKLGRYEIRERLGHGGMATVYKGWDTNLDRWVAVKLLHDHLVDEAGFKERFEREAKVVASLNHPNIVQIYDFASTVINDAPVYYMVMSYIPGQSLKSLMDETHQRGERLGLDQIVSIMRGILNALGYAHKQGMVHRDVTPSNILFNEQGQAMLTDFGIARMLSATRLTQSLMTAGTPMYMSPEQGFGQGGDKRSDLYSVGIILYEMLAGKAPYTGDSAVELIMKHLNEPAPSLRELNTDLTPVMEVVVLQAIAKDPEDRYQNAESFLSDVEQAVGGGQVMAVQPKSQTMLGGRGRARSSRLMWVAGASSLILLIAVLLVLSRLPTGNSAVNAPVETVTLSVLSVSTKQGQTSGASSMTSGPLLFTDDFGPKRGDLIWPLTTDNPTIYRNIENGVYHLRLTRPALALDTVFDPDHQYSDHFRYDADVTISDQSQPDSGVGLIFRHQDERNYYVFGVNGQGAVSLWLLANGNWTELRRQPINWTPFEGAKPAGQTNHLTLYDLGTRIVAMVNNRVAIDLDTQPVIASGAIGIYLATTSSQKIPNPLAEANIDNFSVRYVDPKLPLDFLETGTASPTDAATTNP